MVLSINFEKSYLELETKLSLSELIPIMNDFGIEVLYEERDEKIKLFINNSILPLLNKNQKNFTEVFLATIKKENPSCKLLSLSILENFSLREINLFRTILRYENQLILEFHTQKIVNALTTHHELSSQMLDFFYNRIDKKDVEEFFKKTEDNDRVLRLFFEIISNIIKTNFFLNKPTISIKINTNNLKSYLRGLQPNYEIFVFHKDFSGIHLRMDKVARGGIRYSNRLDDFREEIKSLMITQEAKNAIIVPSGAKGGFVIRKDDISKDELKNIYSLYIDAMLDLVDKDDNYFVVAPDKGTSNLSDVANSIAIQKDFWLQDAFASGGKTGYSHKELGITAKGAIVSVQRYFIEQGIDFFNSPISVVGIGSMGGDVFGNGLLESENFLLVGAISHDEVFFDPFPDPKSSYLERKRLFCSNSHKWSNYDKNLISEGGFVVKRSQKNIKLPKKAKDYLKLYKEFVSGEEIVQAILKLDVDLLYNGGVGTYFKATSETNIEIGDKENEYVRIDAKDIKAKAVCEGGNLGFTQKARYEYALNGGFINLDSIDNSAGVNTSDHEVNLKILLQNHPQRIEILKNQTLWVVKKVLHDNYLQSLAISHDKQRSKENLKRFISTIHVLENSLDIFERRFFFIPTDKLLGLIIDDNNSLIRPVLGILLLYSKIFLKDFLKSHIDKIPNYNSHLFKYFPDEFQKLYQKEILSHPLKDDIVTTVIANKLINHEGSSFIHDFSSMDKLEFLNKIYNNLEKLDGLR